MKESAVLPLSLQWSPEGQVTIYCTAESCNWHWPYYDAESAVAHVVRRHRDTVPAATLANMTESGRITRYV